MSQNELLQITFANDSITCYLISMAYNGRKPVD